MANRNNARRHLKRTKLAGGYGNTNSQHYNYMERFFGSASLNPDPEEEEEDDYQGLSRQDENATNRDAMSVPVDGADSDALEDENNNLTDVMSVYPNGTVIKKVTAYDYSKFESYNVESGLFHKYGSPWDTLCLRRNPGYKVPPSLTSRGLQMTETEFREILKSLSEAANVTFFHKTVDCSITCFYLSGVLIVSFVSFCFWFLVVGGLLHYKTGANSIAGPTFWSFISLVFVMPGAAALIMLAIVIHLANYKYLKYRLKIEEFNKRFRETNLVLHVIRGFWSCSGKLKLYFIYFNFGRCQQNLYQFVYDNVKLSSRRNGGEKGILVSNKSTLKLDKVMKRVNTLTKKFEWDYFEALTKERLPHTAARLHRNKGMCFCQYVLHREQQSVAQQADRDRTDSSDTPTITHLRKTDLILETSYSETDTELEKVAVV